MTFLVIFPFTHVMVIEDLDFAGSVDLVAELACGARPTLIFGDE